MTRAERENAIRCLKLWIEKEPYIQTYKTCLEALEQESCEDWYDVSSNEMNLEQARQAVKDLRKKLVEHLEQEPCEDAISRKALLEDLYKRDYTKFTHRDFVALVQYQDIVAIPSAEPCEDAISREELLKAIESWDRFGVDDTNSLFRLDNLSLPHYVAYIHYDDVVKCIKGMPSVKPQDCDTCEVGNPCLYCKHDFELQEVR